uniref:Uncharacterized protein n=1 Tax=Cacopsylla melanoneura TaxID=428564 RepID=A0A8D9DZJ0_9HEMI
MYSSHQTLIRRIVLLSHLLSDYSVNIYHCGLLGTVSHASHKCCSRITCDCRIQRMVLRLPVFRTFTFVLPGIALARLRDYGVASFPVDFTTILQYKGPILKSSVRV